MGKCKKHREPCQNPGCGRIVPTGEALPSVVCMTLQWCKRSWSTPGNRPIGIIDGDVAEYCSRECADAASQDNYAEYRSRDHHYLADN